MGFRFHRRINLGNGVGINVSKSGISSSLRTKYGSISSKGFSLRTGIPGLTWRGGFGGKNGGAAILLLILVFGGLIVAYNLIRFGIYLIGWIWFNIFSEQGINYKFLFGFLVVVAGLSTALYLYTPPTTSAPPPQTPVTTTAPVVMNDTLDATPKQEKPTRKKREKPKQGSSAIESKPKIEEFPEEMEYKEPEATPAPTADIENETPKEPLDTSKSISESNEVSSPEPTAEELNNEGKKAKWYQFRKRRAEKKQELLESQPDESESKTSD